MPKVRLDDTTEFEIQFMHVDLSKTQRVKNSAKIFGIVFGAAALSILVPIFHFVLVPTLLIASIVAGVRQYRKAFEFNLTDVTCPKCSQNLNEKKVTSNTNKISVYCFNCRTTMWFTT